MKKLITILIILLSSDLFAQINCEKDWSKSIQKEFEFVKTQQIDTVLVYYNYLGPWTNLPDSCNGIPSVWILWTKGNDYYAKELKCNSISSNNSIAITSRPYDNFLAHTKDFELREQYLKRNKFLPPIPTDGSWEYLILMTHEKKINLNLSEHQRTEDIWKQFAWIKPTIESIDITRNELKIK